MGGDGGVIAANRKFLRQCGDGFLNDAQREAVSEQEQKQMRTKVCAASNEKLQEPIVACELGYLYNKDAVLSRLLERTLDPTFAHLRGLKDLIEPKLTRSRAHKEAEAESAAYMCPVTFQEFTGRHPFVVVRTTGWVLSDKALQEVGIDGLQAEYGPFEQDDVIRLAPDRDELADLQTRLAARRERAKADKAKAKGHKRALAAAAVAAGGGDGGAEAAAGGGEGKEGSKKKHKKDRHHSSRSAGAAAAAAQAAPAAASRLVSEATAAVQKQKASSAVYGSLFGTHKPSAAELFASGKAACPI